MKKINLIECKCDWSMVEDVNTPYPIAGCPKCNKARRDLQITTVPSFLFTEINLDILSDDTLSSKLNGMCLDIQDNINGMNNMPSLLRGYFEDNNLPLPSSVEIELDTQHDTHESWDYLGRVVINYSNTTLKKHNLSEASVEKIEEALHDLVNDNCTISDMRNCPIIEF